MSFWTTLIAPLEFVGFSFSAFGLTLVPWESRSKDFNTTDVNMTRSGSHIYMSLFLTEDFFLTRFRIYIDHTYNYIYTDIYINIYCFRDGTFCDRKRLQWLVGKQLRECTRKTIFNFFFILINILVFDICCKTNWLIFKFNVRKNLKYIFVTANLFKKYNIGKYFIFFGKSECVQTWSSVQSSDCGNLFRLVRNVQTWTKRSD